VKQQLSGLFARASALCLLMLLLFSLQVGAQVISGDLVGTVYDKTGAVVPHATVQAVNVETGVKYDAESTEAGEYRFNNLPAGTYKVTANASSFAATTINNFKVELNKTSTLPITLEIKGATTQVEVSGVAVALDTTKATVSNTFDERFA